MSINQTVLINCVTGHDEFDRFNGNSTVLHNSGDDDGWERQGANGWFDGDDCRFGCWSEIRREAGHVSCHPASHPIGPSLQDLQTVPSLKGSPDSGHDTQGIPSRIGTPDVLFVHRSHPVLFCCLLCRGWFRKILFQVNSWCLLVGCRHHDNRGIRGHEACWSVGQNSGIPVCHRWCPDHRSARSGHSLQLQLLLSPWNWYVYQVSCASCDFWLSDVSTDQEDLESTNYNHVQSCPFLPSNVGHHRLRKTSYSDIESLHSHSHSESLGIGSNISVNQGVSGTHHHPIRTNQGAEDDDDDDYEDEFLGEEISQGRRFFAQSYASTTRKKSMTSSSVKKRRLSTKEDIPLKHFSRHSVSQWSFLTTVDVMSTDVLKSNDNTWGTYCSFPHKDLTVESEVTHIITIIMNHETLRHVHNCLNFFKRTFRHSALLVLHKCYTNNYWIRMESHFIN